LASENRVRQCFVKFFIDECLSPSYAGAIRGCGYPDVVHSIHVGLRGVRDDQVVDWAFAADRIIITSNIRDYRRLLALMPLHPGAILVEPLVRDKTWQLIPAALAFVETQPRPADYMVNRVIEVSLTEGVRPYVLAINAT
jgi:hypothetical protein